MDLAIEFFSSFIPFYLVVVNLVFSISSTFAKKVKIFQFTKFTLFYVIDYNKVKLLINKILHQH